MLVKGLRNDGSGGFAIRSGETKELPDLIAARLLEAGSVERTQPMQKQVNWEPSALPVGAIPLFKFSFGR